jgi:hypothetical protein
MPPNDSPHTRRVETQLLEESGEAVGVAIDAEPFRRVGRAPGPRGVPRDDRELVAEPVELPPPRRRPVSHIPVEEHERRPAPGAFVGDLESVDLDHLHGTPPGRFRPGQLRTHFIVTGTTESCRRGRPATRVCRSGGRSGFARLQKRRPRHARCLHVRRNSTPRYICRRCRNAPGGASGWRRAGSI